MVVHKIHDIKSEKSNRQYYGNNRRIKLKILLRSGTMWAVRRMPRG